MLYVSTDFDTMPMDGNTLTKMFFKINKHRQAHFLHRQIFQKMDNGGKVSCDYVEHYSSKTFTANLLIFHCSVYTTSIPRYGDLLKAKIMNGLLFTSRKSCCIRVSFLF